MHERVERLREISDEIDELFTEAMDIVGGCSESLDTTLARLQQDSAETLEEAILAMESDPELLASDDEETDEIEDDELD